MLANLVDLHSALDRLYKLAMSLPEAPLDRFKAETPIFPERPKRNARSSSASARTFFETP
jgi:hypothetical protein